MSGERSAGAACPIPHGPGDHILLGHGSGGTLSAALLRDVFLPAFGNPILDRLDDQAVLDVPGSRLAFTTDSFVVKPLFFPGGDIGSLAVHGTVNDLAMGGATPVALSVAFILEEGLPIETLQRVVASLQGAAEDVGVQIVTGDTKVVERGSGDLLFINTSGIGVVPADVDLSARHPRPGDRILLSGSIGEHGVAVLTQREGLGLADGIRSDAAALNGMVADLLDATRDVRCLRDPTRGGLASALNEIASSAGVGMRIEERAVPVREDVKGACELLGLDPMYVANEGKLIAVVDRNAAPRALAALRAHALGGRAAEIGEVVAERPGTVTLRTVLGTTRILDMLAGDQLPRIC